MKPKLRMLLLALVALVALAGFAVLLFTVGKPAPLPPLPNPNGYDDFTRAGQMRAGQLDDYRTATEEELRAYVMTNTAVLAQVRIGLSRECRVPLDLALTNSANLPKLRPLALLLTAEGRLAEVEHRPADAVRSYVDAIRLGNETGRGGFLIHRLVGIAQETIGYNPLVKFLPALDCEQMRPLIADLEAVDANGVTWEDVQQSERLFVRHALQQTFNPIRHVESWLQNRQTLKTAKAQHNFTVARRRLVLTELALRCYQAEQGHPPEQSEQLVPKYLKRVSTDPFSGQSLIYRAQGTNWLLYSVGPDGVDDGGKPVGRTLPATSATGDLFFDSP